MPGVAHDGAMALRIGVLGLGAWGSTLAALLVASALHPAGLRKHRALAADVRRVADENDKLRAELAAMRAERDHLRKALRLLDHITDGKESSNGTEPEDIQQVVERFVALKAERDDAMAKLAALVEAVSDVCSRGMPGGDSDSAITIYKAEALLRAAIAAARGGAS